MKYYKKGKRPKAWIKNFTMRLEILNKRIQEEDDIGLTIGDYLGEIIAEGQFVFLIRLDCCDSGYTIDAMNSNIYDNLNTDEIRYYKHTNQSFWWVEKEGIRTATQIYLAMETE